MCAHFDKCSSLSEYEFLQWKCCVVVAWVYVCMAKVAEFIFTCFATLSFSVGIFHTALKNRTSWYIEIISLQFTGIHKESKQRHWNIRVSIVSSKVRNWDKNRQKLQQRSLSILQSAHWLLSCFLQAKAAFNCPFKVETRLNSIQEFSPYLKENTTFHHYKDQLVNAV
jgi:hypothetical protein